MRDVYADNPRSIVVNHSSTLKKRLVRARGAVAIAAELIGCSVEIARAVDRQRRPWKAAIMAAAKSIKHFVRRRRRTAADHDRRGAKPTAQQSPYPE
jgi:hypothetical protein